MKSCFPIEGFLATEETREAKTIPIPTPEPAREIEARPAPISLADSRSIIFVFEGF
jgi:hypothetical protein